MSQPEGAPTLQRFLAPKPKPVDVEVCDFCATVVPTEHSHVVDLDTRSIQCACRPCYLLFSNPGAAGGKYRAVPDRTVALPSDVINDAQWDALQIPVGIAYLFYNSKEDRPVAFYPGPAGATQSLLALETWSAVVSGNDTLKTMEPDVEALIVYRKEGKNQAWLVPIDACYELVGRMRLHWRGFQGGDKAWDDIEAFFAQVNVKASS